MNDQSASSPFFTIASLALAWDLHPETIRRVRRSRADLLNLGINAGTTRVYSATEADALKSAVDEYRSRLRSIMHRKSKA